MLITKNTYVEFEEVRKKLERFYALRKAKVLQNQYDPEVELYEKRYQQLKKAIDSVLKMIAWEMQICVKFYYLHGLTIEEISEYVFYGIHSPKYVQEMLDEHFRWLMQMNAKCLPEFPSDMNEETKSNVIEANETT